MVTTPATDEELRCVECDYMLRGLTSVRCPECGTRIDWAAACEAASHPGLPIDQATGWGRIVGGLRTWMLVLFRPRIAASALSDRSPMWPSTVFAVACIALGVVGNWVWGDDEAPPVAWVVGCWFHIECQTVLFFLADLPRRHRLRRWAFWRKVSLFTTAFVVLDWFGGPPVLSSFSDANFPWPLEGTTWSLRTWWPTGKHTAYFVVRGAAYYWWMVVLTVILLRRLRRRWVLALIIPLMPLVTIASCRVGYDANRGVANLIEAF